MRCEIESGIVSTAYLISSKSISSLKLGHLYCRKFTNRLDRLKEHNHSMLVDNA